MNIFLPMPHLLMIPGSQQATLLHPALVSMEQDISSVLTWDRVTSCVQRSPWYPLVQSMASCRRCAGAVTGVSRCGGLTAARTHFLWTSQIFQNQANSIQADGELVSSLSSDHCMTRLCQWLHGNYVKYLIGLHKMECTFHLAGDLWFFLMVHAELHPPFIPWLITVHF